MTVTDKSPEQARTDDLLEHTRPLLKAAYCGCHRKAYERRYEAGYEAGGYEEDLSRPSEFPEQRDEP